MKIIIGAVLTVIGLFIATQNTKSVISMPIIILGAFLILSSVM